MKKISLILVCICIPATAHAVLSVVTDPSSYTYYVQQIAKMEQQLQNGMNQLTQLTSSSNSLIKMKNELEGAYNRVAGLPERLKTMSKQLNAIPSNLQYQETQLTTNTGHLSDGTTSVEDPWKDIKKSMDGIWCDPRNPGCDPRVLRNAQYSVRQHIYKSSMANAEDLLKSEAGRIKKLNDLASQIDSTVNLKDATDLSNRFLMELLIGQRQMIRLLAYMAQAAAVTNYYGVTSKGDTASSTTTGSSVMGSAKPAGADATIRAITGHAPIETDKEFFNIISTY